MSLVDFIFEDVFFFPTTIWILSGMQEKMGLFKLKFMGAFIASGKLDYAGDVSFYYRRFQNGLARLNQHSLDNSAVVC